jgi:chromosome segregation ATPase
LTLLIILNQFNLNAQGIENMGKKELRKYCSVKLREIDSLNSLINTITYQSLYLNKKIDSITSEFKTLKSSKEKTKLNYENCKKTNQEMLSKLTSSRDSIKSLNDSLGYFRSRLFISGTDNDLRELIINKYLLNKSFGLFYIIVIMELVQTVEILLQ